MSGLLYLTHRIPYPPNKGDKIRSYNVLKHLAKEFDIYLGTFIDDPNDWQHVAALQEICSGVAAFDLSPTWRKMASLIGLFKGECLTVPYYANTKMRAWVRETIREKNVEKALAFSSPMAQYLDSPEYGALTRVIDFVDVDSVKWREFAKEQRWPANVVYAREARTLLSYEKKIAERFDSSLFVSQAEADVFINLSGLAADKVKALNNGVDIRYFDPEIEQNNPYDNSQNVLVFTGAMDYWANADAVSWFATDIFPSVLETISDAEFWIVGSRPTDAVSRLAESRGVYVTGAVPDVRPYVKYAAAAVAPLRLARGIQNKVLEAMAMAKPVVATPQALEGIDIGTAYQSLITDNNREMIDICRTLLTSKRYDELGVAGRAYVEQHHEWSGQLSKLSTFLNKGAE